jgi:hypothetical protein
MSRNPGHEAALISLAADLHQLWRRDMDAGIATYRRKNLLLKTHAVIELWAAKSS